jgi:molybdopterin adenylyltransferase
MSYEKYCSSSRDFERTGKEMKIAVLCISDSGFAGERADKSGPLIIEMMKELAQTVSYVCLPDEKEMISAQMIEICDAGEVDVILTTGGTGFAPRDVTPEATLAVIERAVPGIPEAMRQKSLEITDRAMLSRSMAGIRGKTLIINLPGSPKAVMENLETVMPVLGHAVELINNRVKNCATEK